MSSISQVKTNWKILIPAWCIWLVYLLGWVFPEPFWGVHHLAFLPTGVSASILVASLILLLLPLVKPWQGIKSTSGFLPKSVVQWLVPLVLALIAVNIFPLFSLSPDPYGDAFYLKEDVDYPPLEWESKWLSDFFSFTPLEPKGGTLSLYTLVNLVSAAFQVPGIRAFELVSIWSGGLFVFLWSFLVIRNLQKADDRLLFLLVGLTASACLQFFGHIEVYGPSLALSIGFFILVLEAINRPKKLAWWLLVPVFLLNIKFHFTAYLLFPALLLVYLNPLGKKSGFINKLFTWKGLLLRYFLPLGIMAILVYVFLTDSVNGQRSFTEDTVVDALFLPISSSEDAPLDRYNLIGINHFWDYFNTIVLWSPLALGLLLGLTLGSKDRRNWSRSEVLILATAFISYLGAFFLLNPLLGMGFDWDLFCLPVPSLLVLTLLVYKTRKENGFSLLPMGIGLALLASTYFLTHFNQNAFSYRLESLSRFHYKTYYLGVSTGFEDAFTLDSDPENVIKRRLRVIDDLEAYAVPGNDIEYADLLMAEGKRLFSEKKDYPNSIAYFQKAFYYSPNLSENVYYLILNHFLLGQYSEAVEYGPRLIGIAYPDQEKAYRICIHTAIMAHDRARVTEWCGGFLKAFPGDEFINEVLKANQQNANWKLMEGMFASG